ALMMILRSCLAFDPAERWQSAADLAKALQLLSGTSDSQPGHKAQTRRWILPAALCLLAFVVVLVAAMWPNARSDVISFALTPPAGGRFPVQPSLAIAPDGKRVVFAAFNEAGERLLWLRRLGADEAEALPSTTGGTAPFWSPDGQSLGFFT